MTKGLEDYMLPCVSKKFFGIECLGCGMQRATAFLFRGEFLEAFKMYPAIYPLFGLLIFLILNLFLKFKHAERIKVSLVIAIITLVLGNFIIKLIIH